MTTRRLPAIFLLTSLSLGLLHCSSNDDSDNPGTAGKASGNGGAVTIAGAAGSSAGAQVGGTSAGGAPLSAGSSGKATAGIGGAAAAGAPAAGAPAGGASSAGSAGAGGANGGSGGGTGGQSGASSGGVSGGAAGRGGGGSSGASGSAGQGGGSGIALTSSALMEGASFGPTNTCAGDNGSPPLAWTPGPSGTQSYAIVLQDLSNMLYHWVIWDIPSSVTMLPANLPDGMTLTAPVTAKQRSIGAQGAYQGPCPNGMEHTYQFTIYAINTATLTVTGNNAQAVANAAQMNDIASATLSGKSDARRP